MGKESWAVINVSGRDRPGIIADVSGLLARKNVNIVDIGHSVIYKMFAMFMVVDLGASNISYSELDDRLCRLGKELSLNIELSRLDDGLGAECPRSSFKDNYVLSILARDRVGIVYDVVRCLSEEDVNVLKIALVARDKLITIEMLVDIGKKGAKEVRDILRNKGDSMGMDIIFQRESVFKREKRLVVFDMDSTIVDAEIIDEIARKAGIGSEVRALTEKAMNGEIDFKESLRRRVGLLRGLPESVLREVYDGLSLTHGARELVSALKAQGYKTALVSGGFTYFTDKLNDVLHFDHVYANKLVIRDNKVIGEIEGDIVDAERKGAIIEELREMYGLKRDQVVAVGDGANDQIMLENAGLGIAFNAKEALKKVSSGTVSKENLSGLLGVLGVESS